MELRCLMVEHGTSNPDAAGSIPAQRAENGCAPTDQGEAGKGISPGAIPPGTQNQRFPGWRAIERLPGGTPYMWVKEEQ